MITRVKVLGYTFKITHERNVGNEETWGTFDPVSMTINIHPDAPDERARQTLWHETIHAIEFALGIELVENDEVSIPNLLALGIVDVLKHNPEMR